jgi:hypothetical protein
MNRSRDENYGYILALYGRKRSNPCFETTGDVSTDYHSTSLHLRGKVQISFKSLTMSGSEPLTALYPVQRPL